MKTSLIIAFAILILAKQILCLAETPLLTDKNNTKNDTTQSNIHDEKANNITQNISTHPPIDHNFNTDRVEKESKETAQFIEKIIIITFCIIVAVLVGFTCGITCGYYCLPYEDRSEQDESPRRPVQQVLMPDEIELQPRRRREPEVLIAEDLEE